MRLEAAEKFGRQAGQAVSQVAGEANPVVTRFAPSPNGLLHLGHAYAAIAAHDFARAAGGKFLLRLEDIDGIRIKPEYIDAIIADMKWLGLEWDGEVIFQSQRTDSYAHALERLKQSGLAYPCICSRGDIREALKSCPVRHGPDGPQYPQTCKGRDIDLGKPHCWRLDMTAALEECEPTSFGADWTDMAAGAQHGDPALFGDIVLWRKDAPASYHLAATLDDAAYGVSHIVRGQDLFAYSALHRLIQNLFKLPQPTYWHHALILDSDGEKLAKSRDSASLKQLRDAGQDGRAIADDLRKGKLSLGMTLSSV